MKKHVFTLLCLLIICCLLMGCEPKSADGGTDTSAPDTTEHVCDTTPFPSDMMPVPAKPVIYFYPEVKTDIDVTLDFNGTLSFTYPEYKGIWRITAHPDGTVYDRDTGLEYSYLFWEGISNVEYDMSRGFVVKGENTAEFLRTTLAEMGLTPREYNEFIVYWLPRMQGNAYNLICFQSEVYTENAKLNITPKPDSMLRIFMAFRPLEQPIEIQPQTIKPFIRHGFCVVEWGGAEIQ